MTLTGYGLWLLRLAPILALTVVWKSYDSNMPKIIWTAIIILGFVLFNEVVGAAISFIIFIFHIFVLHQKQMKDAKDRHERMLEKAIESQKDMYR